MRQAHAERRQEGLLAMPVGLLDVPGEALAEPDGDTTEAVQRPGADLLAEGYAVLRHVRGHAGSDLAATAEDESRSVIVSSFSTS